MTFLNYFSHNLKVPYYEKQVFSGLYIYKLVLPEPANSQNEENKRFLHGLCSPPTDETVLRQAAQILLQTGDRHDANSVQGFGDCVGDKHSFR